MNTLIEAHLPCPHCGSSDAYSEYSDNFFCFSCKKSVSKFHKKEKRIVRNSRIENTITVELPEDFTTELPQSAKSWLYGYHFDDGLIAKANIGCSHESRIWSARYAAWVPTGPRVILPYFDYGKLKFFEGRDISQSAKLKYISVGGKGPCYWSQTLRESNYTVIVEDIISAIRVGQVCNCVALRGTSFNAEKIQEIIKHSSNNIIVWLDSDKPGQEAARKLKRKLEVVGRKVKSVKTQKDPKYYSNEQIKDIVYV